MDGNLFMVMDRPLRKGNSECEWEKAEKIHNMESKITFEITFAEQL